MNTPTVQWSAIAPELVLLGTACFLLVTGAFMRGASARRFSATVALLAFMGAGLAAWLLWDHDTWLVMAGQLRIDRFTTIIRLLVVIAGLVTVLSSWGTRRLDEHIGEYYALLLTASAGMSLLAGANGFVTLFVALELFSLALYVLCALDLASLASLEAGLKYLVIGSVGSAFLLFGSGLIYGGTKSLRFDGIIQSIQSGGTQHDELILLGIGMVVAGLAFKASAAPFHMWTPDAYEGAPTAITGFMAAATKTVALAVLLRVLVQAFQPSSDVWEDAVAAIAIASMAVGNIAALAQTNAKRMLAYSSIGQAGYLLIPVVAHTQLAGKALIYYLAVYSAMNLGAFAVIQVREREVQRPVGLHELSGWGYARPWLGAALALFLFSLASFPPTGGFLAKLYLFSSAVDADKTYLAVIGVIATMVSIGYYLRFALVLYARPSERAVPAHRVPGTLTAGSVVAVAAAAVIWLGVAPSPMLRWADEAAHSIPLQTTSSAQAP
jgi:NADH-quinone oxidoreductase subunit N